MDKKNNFFGPQFAGADLAISQLQTLDPSLDFTFGGVFRGGFMVPDGSQLLLIDYNPDVWQYYNLSTAWDLSTAVYQGTIVTNNTSPFGTYMSPSGVWAGSLETNHRFRHTTLSTAYDMSTKSGIASYGGIFTSNYPRNPKWNGDGFRIYTHSQASPFLFYYNLTNAYDITTVGAKVDGTNFINITDWEFADSGNYILTASGTTLGLRKLSVDYDPQTQQGVVLDTDTLYGTTWNIQVIDTQGLLFFFEQTTGFVVKYSFTITPL